MQTTRYITPQEFTGRGYSTINLIQSKRHFKIDRYDKSLRSVVMGLNLYYIDLLYYFGLQVLSQNFTEPTLGKVCSSRDMQPSDAPH